MILILIINLLLFCHPTYPIGVHAMLRKCPSPVSKRRFAFTLIEILVVMIIIGMLVAMLLPAVQKVREAARRSNCGANMHQIGIAMANYESSHGHFPASWNPVAPNANGNIDG